MDQSVTDVKAEELAALLPTTREGAGASNTGRLFIALEGAVASLCNNDEEREKLSAKLIIAGPQWVKDNYQRMINGLDKPGP